jgi:3'-5' exonuclease
MRAAADEKLTEDLKAIRAPSNYKDAAKIEEYVAAAQSKLIADHDASCDADWLKTSFDGGVGQICVIGWALDDQRPSSFQCSDLSADREALILSAFFTEVARLGAGTRVTWIGHNHVGFDLPFIWKRAMVLGVKPPFNFPRNPKPWSENVFDTMVQWDSQQRAGGSMDRLCRLLGIPGKGDISGADVWPMVQAGRIEEVAKYCRDDVERTRALHRRMTFAIAA